MIGSFRSKALRRFWEEGDRRGLRPDMVERILELLTLLHAARTPDGMRGPGLGFHGLQGRPRRYAVSVNKNWRITFGWENGKAIDVELEDYH
jgi:proteic killer suppression protein